MSATFRSALWAAAAMLLVSAYTCNARAGGMEYPDNGARALGRGAAFTAKADDGTALIHNVAGFARQRGWRLTLGANTAFHSAAFQRAGTYKDDGNNPLTPWGGERYPLVQNTGKPLPIPHLVLSTDFGTERFTMAGGIYAPSVLTGRVFPLSVEGRPSPARYDAVQAGGVILYPTLGGAYRLADWIDVGLAASYVFASLEATSVSSADLAKAICPNQEFQPCDARQSVATKGGAAAFTAAVMLHPARWLAIGAQLRTAHTLETAGTVSATSPAVQPGAIAPAEAYLTQSFPWIARTGIRYIGFRGEREVWDVEVDATYEAWGSALGEGTKVYIPKLSAFENIRSTIRLGFKDTFSLRAGGSYRFDALGGGVIVRAGAFHDTAATDAADTRLTFDTAAKTGVTVGAGLDIGPVRADLGLAQIFHETREVREGSVRPINGAQGGTSVSSSGTAYEPVNEGVYAASTFVVALGLTVQIDALWGGRSTSTRPKDDAPKPPERPAADDERAARAAPAAAEAKAEPTSGDTFAREEAARDAAIARAAEDAAREQDEARQAAKANAKKAAARHRARVKAWRKRGSAGGKRASRASRP